MITSLICTDRLEMRDHVYLVHPSTGGSVDISTDSAQNTHDPKSVLYYFYMMTLIFPCGLPIQQ